MNRRFTPPLRDSKPNRDLLRNVAPDDWQNPVANGRYNLAVLGGGTAGLVCAAAAAGLGAKVALIEERLLGGDCLNFGCVPSKALIHSARAHSAALRSGDPCLSERTGNPADFGGVIDRLEHLRAEISHHDSYHRFTDLGVDIFRGRGRFTSPSTLEVEGREIQFRKAVIATGSRAMIPAIPGLAETRHQTNETIFSLDRLPPRLLVVGGGPIGCELAQAFAQLGSKVTVVEMASTLLPREDPEAAGILADQFRQEGIAVHLRARVIRIQPAGQSSVVEVQGNGEAFRIEVEEVLVAAGRVPNVDNLGLEAARVHFDPRSGVVVDDFLRTSNHDIYAAGDVALPQKFTHAADAAARLVIQNALFLGRKRWSRQVVPWCTYTFPEVAQVGLTEQDAEKVGVAVSTIKIPFSSLDRAVLDSAPNGFLKVHVRKGSDRIVGATIVGARAGEIVGEISVAIGARMGLAALSTIVHPYPTYAEAVRKAGDAFRRTRLTPFVQRLLRVWLSWMR